AGTLTTLAAAITHAVGAVMIDHFESGGTLQDLDRALLRRELCRGWRLLVELDRCAFVRSGCGPRSGLGVSAF
ncbi:MAG: hypothetical protein JZU52_09210, partial [Lamprocystis purpurea]|nr:hypothetical protein [Lamprocystis purpurea]